MAKKENTDERRERVKELFGKSDRRVALMLIEEGFFGPTPRVKQDRIRFEASARRTITNDRHWWREHWRNRKPRTSEDSAAYSEEYIAKLRTRIEDLEDVIDDPATRATAKVNAFAEIRQLEEMIAKAQGADALDRRDTEDDDAASSLPFLGLVLNVTKVSPEAIAKAETLKKTDVSPRKHRSK